MKPLVDIALTTSFYNTISPSNFALGQQPNTADVPQGVVSDYWLGGRPARSLLPSGHEVEVEERKGGGREESHDQQTNKNKKNKDLSNK